jgi:hypothetical protein
MNNFIGQSWIGVVENTEDPLKQGRVKVRIFGHHTEDLIALPTAALPWCTLMTGPNAAGSFNVPEAGAYVTGYFADGESTQNPYIAAVLPGIQAAAPDTSIGFSPQPLFPNSAPTEAEKAKPVLPPNIQEKKIGEPDTPLTARGIVVGSGVGLTNANLSHVCDFRYQFKFDIGLSGLTNPITAIQNAIKEGKNNAANIIRFLISKLNDEIKLALKALVTSMNLDPTGQISTIYATLKFKLDDINDYIEKIAGYVAIASTIYYLVQDINQIVTYLQSLPARFLAIVKDCIATFLNGVKAFGAAVAAVPGQIGATVDSLAKQIQSNADTIIAGLTSEVNSITVPDALKGVFTDPLLDHSNTITTYISTVSNTANVMATVTENHYDPTKVQWA